MKFLRLVFAAYAYFCLATILAQLGLFVVLWQRGRINAQVAEAMLTVAYDVPVREIYDKLAEESHPAQIEMVSFGDVQESYMTASLNLDLREMSSDKGLIDLRELDVLMVHEGNRYTEVHDDFERRWAAMQMGATDSELQEVRRQIESVNPKVAKDQLLRILDDQKLEPDMARQNVVTLFKNLPIDKRKKIIAEFKEDDAPRLQGILREIRLGMPEVTLIRETRDQLRQFNTRN